MRACPHCNSQVPADSLYCPYCRNDINAAPQAAPGAPRGAVPGPTPMGPGAPGQRSLADDAGMRMLLPVGRSGWAIAAGYAGLFGLLVFPAPLALVLGAAAVWHLKSKPDLRGWGRAIFGLAVGVIGTAILALGLIGS